MIQALGGDVLAGYDSRNGSPSPSPWLNRRHAAALAAQHRWDWSCVPYQGMTQHWSISAPSHHHLWLFCCYDMLQNLLL